MAGGRPTKYTKEVLEKTKEYLLKYEEIGDVIPSIEGLSEYIEVTRPTIYDWAKQEDKSEFSNTLEQIQAKQKKVLLHKGLTNDFNSAITKLALGNHGMTEKMQQEVSGPGGRPQEHKWVVEFIEAKQNGHNNE